MSTSNRRIQSVQVAIRMTPELAAEAERCAEREDRSVSAVLRRGLRLYLAQNEIDRPVTDGRSNTVALPATHRGD
jgi:hypothetical protein